MPKRIRILLTVSLLILLGFFIFKYFSSPTNSLRESRDQVDAHSHEDQETEQRHKKVAQKNTQSSSKTNSDSQKSLSKELEDPKRNIIERVYQVKDLKIDSSSEGLANAEELVVFINSENPYLNDPEAREPHSFKANQLKREASLRVFSIKRLSQELSGKNLYSKLNSIISGSQDQAIVNIAKQVLSHKKNGEDYFENVKNAIKTMPSPIPTKEEHEGHKH
ncbi:MAG: hypothetical protein CME63_04460 [Halobacteriovoraceae bacterium]|jgi:hypothetical protein|nr:hypothetical protein [Halobacteriovoraceae bacterium]|tara:strand:+ start:24394 stop:25056 length:663 start_codon:yes stop_codon:yes gene_type:complete